MYFSKILTVLCRQRCNYGRKKFYNIGPRSLYILIDRTADEIKMGDLKWPFWTKLVVVAIGFTGGLVFMYIQCKVRTA